jgi:hypothetical protein
MAAQLPGWGELELARRGRALAEDFGTLLSPQKRAALARDALPFADSAVFAGALLEVLGPAGMRDTLLLLGDGIYAPTSALARLVALVLGAVSPARGGSAVAEVLATEYVPAADPDPRNDLAVLGMGTVLAASAELGSRGLAPGTVAAWGGQIALRERTMGVEAGGRVNPMSLDAEPVDPLPFVVAILADGPDPVSAAAFLNGPSVWDVLLARAWDDCGTALNRLIHSAVAVAGPEGDAVVRGGLEALGAGLEDGDPADWTVKRAAANAVSPALGAGLARHVSVAGQALAAGADGDLDAGTGDLLRGLGFLTLDRNAAAVVEEALHGWVAAEPVAIGEDGSLPRLPAIVIPNAYLAVQNYGQELAYTLQGFEKQEEAENRSFLWNMTVGLAASLAPGPWGVAAGVVEGYVGMWLGFDGTWDNGTDRGLTFRADTGLASLTSDERGTVDQIVQQAHGSFDATASALGHPRPPTSPESHWWEPLAGAVLPGPGDVVERLGPRIGRGGSIANMSPIR